MDILSKPTFVPREHHLLFAFLLAYLSTCSLALLLHRLPCLSCLSVLCIFICFASFPFLACLLVYCLCLCMYTHGVRTLGARAQSPRHKHKGHGCKHVDISQAACSVDLRV